MLYPVPEVSMTFSQSEPTPEIVEEKQEDLTSVFHRINNVIPEDQELLCVSLDTPVLEALSLMKEKNYSQVPITAGEEVLGVFTYRSFALKIQSFLENKANLNYLTVGDFIETAEFVHVLEDLVKTIAPLDREDVVLVGSWDNLQGVLTSINLTKYLYQLSKPFLLLGEIEKAIRKILHGCIPNEDLQNAITLVLSNKYQPEEMPLSIEEMEFSDYTQIIGSRVTWHYFENAFGKGSWRRPAVIASLEKIRVLRNDVFHFKRQLTDADFETLISNRDWLKKIVTAYQAKKQEGQHGNKP
jgi:predicted transcriptional regulator